MTYQLAAPLLDACVLGVLAKEDAYGYTLTQKVMEVVDISESTLYPVLRRLQKDDCLEVYDRECAGRNRRYYKITAAGEAQLGLYRSEWMDYSRKITAMFAGEELT